MLLRASSENSSEINLTALTDSSVDSGVEFGTTIMRLTEELISLDSAFEPRTKAYETIRDSAAVVMGEQLTINVLTVASGFNAITRVADATGIELDPHTAESTEWFRQDVGIDDFHQSIKLARYG